MKFYTFLSRITALSALVAGLILPATAQTVPTAPAPKSLIRVASTPKKTKPTSKNVKKATPLSPLEKMAAEHAAKYAALAHKAAGGKVTDEDEEEGKEKGKSRASTGGEEFMRQMRAYPNDVIDRNAFDRALQQRSRMPAARIGLAGSSNALRLQAGQPPQAGSFFPSATWSFAGPINWYPIAQRAYYGLESMNGHIESIAVDPTNALVLYAASQTGGVFKSTDGGINWTSVSSSWLYLRTNVVAINPKNSKIVYAGTGTSPTGFGNAIGLMKTTDGGTTWTNIGADKDANGQYLYFAGQNVTRVLVDVQNPNIVTVFIGDTQIGSSISHSATSNIWVSTDAGTTWSKKVAVFPAGPGSNYTDRGSWDDAVLLKSGTYLAVGQGPGTGDYNTAFNYLLYKSADQGVTWAQVANAPIPPSTPIGVDPATIKGARLAASPITSGTVYLLYAYSDHVTLFKSTDSGTTWNDVTVNSGINNSTSGVLAPSAASSLDQVPYDYYLACSSRKVNGVATDVLYVGLKSVFQQVQTPGNTKWTDVATAYGEFANIHSDQHCIAFAPTNPDKGWFGNDGGIYQFYSNPTTGVTNFLSLNDKLQTTQFYQTSYHPTNPNFMLGGTQDNGVAGAFGDLNSWQMTAGGDGCYTLINPVNPNTIYFSTQKGNISRSDDAYASGNSGVTDISPDKTAAGTGTIAFVTPLAIDVTNPNFVYTAGSKLGRYDATKPLATAWTYFPTVLTTSQASTLAVSPADGKRIFVATLDGKLWTTPDGGTTWVSLKAGTDGETLPNKNIGCILPDPANSKAVLIGLSGTGTPHVYYCPDVTVDTPTWTNLNGTGATAIPDAALNALAIDPADANTLYAANDVGVFQSTDRGVTWTNATAPLSLPNVQVNDLKAMPLQGYLYAGTWGRGIWRIRIRNNDPLSGILFNPERIIGGNAITGTVLLGSNAPAGGMTVNLTSDTPAAASVPSSVTVPEGQNQASFSVTTFPVGFTTPAKITASIGSGAGQSKSGSITVLSGTVLPSLQTLEYVDYGGGINAPIGYAGAIQARVTLSKPAPSDIMVTLSSTDGSVAVPATVTVLAGSSTALFDVTFSVAANPVSGKVTAKLGAFQKSITYTRN